MVDDESDSSVVVACCKISILWQTKFHAEGLEVSDLNVCVLVADSCQVRVCIVLDLGF